ncbi:MAG: ABC transporter permease [Rhodospirillaceae bacterium]|nr:ABC transporter permease [Rhodospirillaceae bacterium]
MSPVRPGWRAPRRLGPVNGRGLWTLYRREVWRVLKDYRDSLLGPAVSSVLLLAVFDLALGGTVGTGVAPAAFGGVGVLQFLGPGLIIFTVCDRAFETASASLLFDKMEGMIQDTLMAPLSAAERTLGYALSAATAGLLAGGVVAAAVLLFVRLPVASPGCVLLFAAGGALLHAGIGILVGMWATRWEHFAAALSFAIVPLAYLSGMFYPVSALPAAGRDLVAINPVFYVIDGFRYGFIGHADGPLPVAAALVAGLAVALLAVAHRLFARGALKA